MMTTSTFTITFERIEEKEENVDQKPHAGHIHAEREQARAHEGDKLKQENARRKAFAAEHEELVCEKGKTQRRAPQASRLESSQPHCHTSWQRPNTHTFTTVVSTPNTRYEIISGVVQKAPHLADEILHAGYRLRCRIAAARRTGKKKPGSGAAAQECSFRRTGHLLGLPLPPGQAAKSALLKKKTGKRRTAARTLTRAARQKGFASQGRGLRPGSACMCQADARTPLQTRAVRQKETSEPGARFASRLSLHVSGRCAHPAANAGGAAKETCEPGARCASRLSLHVSGRCAHPAANAGGAAKETCEPGARCASRLSLVEVKRLELPTSCSQSRRATNCATPRKKNCYLFYRLLRRKSRKSRRIRALRGKFPFSICSALFSISRSRFMVL